MIARLCLVLAVILAVAFLIRLAAVLPIDVDPRVGWHYDMTWYDGVARRLLRGWGYVDPTGVPTAAWPPGYPLLLVAVYSVFGPSVLVAKIANVLLGTATVLLTHLIACQLGRPGVGLVAAAIVALFPGLVLLPLLLPGARRRLFFFGSSRLHVPLLPVLALMAAAEIVAWAERLRWSAMPQRA